MGFPISVSQNLTKSDSVCPAAPHGSPNSLVPKFPHPAEVLPETFRLDLKAASDGESTTSLGKLFCWLISFTFNVLGAMRTVIHGRNRDVQSGPGEVWERRMESGEKGIKIRAETFFNESLVCERDNEKREEEKEK